MLDWYLDLSARVRMAIAIALLGLGVIIACRGLFHHTTSSERAREERIDPALASRSAKNQIFSGAVVAAVGLILLAFAGKSDSEKSGYRSG